MTIPAATTPPPIGDRLVRWNRVWLFYGMALGWVTLVAVALYLALDSGVLGGAATYVAPAVLAPFYMTAPLASALIVERLDGRRPLITTTFAGFGRALPRLLAVGVGMLVLGLAAMLGASWLFGNLLGAPGAGRVITEHSDLVDRAIEVAGDAAAGVPREVLVAGIPEFWPLIGITLVSSLVAGFTINALFAFGEEYGWRGWLADELRPLGAVRANLLTGVLWGLWHAPIIMLLGHNYAPHNLVGPLFMVAFCIPLSFLFWWAREVTGSLLAPAILHGLLNAFAGLFVSILADPNPLIAAPAGLVGALAVGVVAALLWVVWRPTPNRPAGQR